MKTFNNLFADKCNLKTYIIFALRQNITSSAYMIFSMEFNLKNHPDLNKSFYEIIYNFTPFFQNNF